MSQPLSTGSRIAVVAVVLLASAGVARLFLTPAPTSESPRGDPTSAVQTAVHERACDADSLSRVRGIEVGTMITPEWGVDAIRCVTDDPCILVDLTHPPELLTIRFCPHREGAPLPPASRGGSDIFWDTPHEPAPVVADATIHAVLDAVVARSSALDSE